MKFAKKLAILSKKINSKLVSNKKFIKAKQNQFKRKVSMLLHTSNTVDSVYRKDENYYLKLFLE